MIEDKKSMKSDELNIPDDYFNKRKNNEELMLVKKKHGLIRSFFLFWGLIIISLGIAALYLHFLGVLIFMCEYRIIMRNGRKILTLLCPIMWQDYLLMRFIYLV